MRNLSLFIAASLDGYIAKPGDDLRFLKRVEMEGEDYGYSAFMENIDTVILGRRTYDYVERHIGTSHYDNGQHSVYVITRSGRPSIGKTTFYTGDLAGLVRRLKNENGKGIYCDGGADVIDGLLKADLVDEFIISVVPILAGEGTRLFKGGRPEHAIELMGVRTFDTGLVQLRYRRKR